MTARVDLGWSYRGLPVVRLENRALAVDVLPTMGAKILNLVDKAADRQVLWRNPRVPVRPGPIGADVDDYFAGGWDDAFPTGDPCAGPDGDALPYMGEIWNAALDVEVLGGGGRAVAVAFSGHTPITPARWTRTLRLEGDDPLLVLETEIENVGHRPLSFIWGSHPALAVRPGMRLDVPAAAGRVSDAGTGGPLGALGQEYRYPEIETPDGRFDVRAVPGPELARHALHGLSELRAGWVAATDPQAGRGFGVVFDPSLHRAVWQWMAYGGFRGWYHAILEPWTTTHTSLAAALEAGEATTLAPGERLATRMTGVLYGGVRAVTHLGADGAVAA